MKILLLEDDESLAEALAQTLLKQNYSVDRAPDGQTGWDFTERFEYDLIILNIELPKIDGILFCQHLRQKRNDTPILLLTAQDNSFNKVQGLDAGADDYLVKPFDLKELLARIRALLRRGSLERTPLLTWGKLQLDPSRCEVKYATELLHLSPKEYSLLEFFLRNPQRVISHNLLLDRLWSAEDVPTEVSLRAHIKKLRHKLREAGAENLIETVYGVGYRLKLEPDAETERQGDQALPLACFTRGRREIETTVDTTVEAGLATLWQRYQKRYLDRVAVLEKIVWQLQRGTLSDEHQQQAQQQIHILAGSLGSFGLEKASQICRSLEQSLHQLDGTPLNIPVFAQLVAALRQELQTSTSPTLSLAESDPVSAGGLHRSGRLLIVDDDAVLVERLESAALNLNWQVESVANVSQARAAIARQPPTAILLDLCFPSPEETGYELLQELASKHPTIPVFVLTVKEALSDRIRVAQLGGRRFIPKSLSPQQVIQSVTEMMQAKAARILVVDEDVQLLELLQSVLEPHGFEFTLLNEPQKFCQVLEQTHPDLLMLNFEMPQVNGIELCQVVRNDMRWSRLPVIFLSADTNAETVQQSLAAGADDFVAKPIDPSDLLLRLSHRLHRF